MNVNKNYFCHFCFHRWDK